MTARSAGSRPAGSVLLVAHGDGGANPRDATVRALAAGLAERLGVPVAWATLKRPETFAVAAAELTARGVAPGDLRVIPLFMAAGWFVRRKLPALLAEHGLAEAMVLTPIGLDPALADLVATRVAAIRSDLGAAGAAARLVLVAHGSASGETANRTNAEAIAARLTAATGVAPVLAYIEETPRFDAVIGADGPEVVVGLFVSAGTHALDDVATHVARVETVLAHLPAIGEDPAILDLVLGLVERSSDG